jgi:predicted metal-dependent hydrolase
MVTPSYTLLRSRRRKKTISLHVGGNGNVIIRAPWSLPQREIDAFFAARESWLADKLKEKERQREAALRPSDGILYLGKPRPVTILPQDGRAPSLSLVDDGFSLRCDDASRRGEIIAAWFRLHGAIYFRTRLGYFSDMTGLLPSGVRVSNALHRWGSCSPHNRISLSWRLVTTPPSVIDYVIVHELAHIREKNHGSRFWHCVESIMPDHRERRRRLRE